MKKNLSEKRVIAKRYAARYYDISDESIEEVLDLWSGEGAKAYDKDVHRWYSLWELLPYREYEWSSGKSRLSPAEWLALKGSVAMGWDRDNPIYVIVYRTGHAKVGEGNHRLGVMAELLAEDPERFLGQANNIPVQFLFYEG